MPMPTGAGRRRSDDHRVELLRRLDRSAETVAACDAAIPATDNTAERACLVRKRGELVAPR